MVERYGEELTKQSVEMALPRDTDPKRLPSPKMPFVVFVPSLKITTGQVRNFA